jgi:integrase
MVEDVITEEEFIKKFRLIDNIRDKAFCSVIYLTAGRVSEILFSLKVKDIIVDKYMNKLFYIFSVFTSKRKEKDIFRKIPIPYEDYHKELLDSVLSYIKQYGLKESSFLFEFNRRTAYNIVMKWFKFRTHYMRHTRLTHLVSMYSYHPLRLQAYAGWTNLKQTSRYIHQSWKDMAKDYEN